MIAENLNRIRASLPEGVTLVAVSKFHPVEQLLEAYSTGQRVFGENRPQELAAKVPQMPPDVRWHFLGHLQTNKLKLVLPHVELVHSVDSLHLLEAIDRWGGDNDRVVDILLEVHISSDASKQGFSPDEVRALLCPGAVCPPAEGTAMECRGSETCATLGSLEGGAQTPVWEGRGRSPRVDDPQYSWPVVGGHVPENMAPEGAKLAAFGHVRIRGLMGMATLTEDEQQIEAEFAALKSLFDEIRSERPELATFDQLSMGMSGDWPIAVRHGATMIRIGTDIFGPREY